MMPVMATLIVPFINGWPVTLLLKYPKKINARMVTVQEA